jgi:hypothetical protein
VDLRPADRICVSVHEETSQTGNTLGLRLLDSAGASQEVWSDDPAAGGNPVTRRLEWVEMCFATSAFTQVDRSRIERLQLTTYWPGTYHFDHVIARP